MTEHAKRENDDTEALLLSSSMEAPQLLSVPGGQVALFSRPSPDKSTANEDSMAVISVHGLMTILAVADGLGGSREGKEASATAIHCLRDALNAAQDERASVRTAVLNGLEQANRDIIARGIGSATTIVVAAITGDFLRTYHVGDSGLLQIGQRGRIKQKTVAHSPVGFAEASGMLTEEEALHHAERHFVSNTLGITQMSIEVGPPMKLNQRDTVLLASDGLFDNLRTEEIIARARAGALDKCADRLQSSVLHRMATPHTSQPSKPDDLSFILYRRTR